MRKNVCFDYFDCCLHGLANVPHCNLSLSELCAMQKLLPKIIKNELTRKQQEIIKLVCYDCKTQKEVANVLGITQCAVSKSLNAAKDVINNQLAYIKMAFDLFDK